jgi:hypothetical protein
MLDKIIIKKTICCVVYFNILVSFPSEAETYYLTANLMEVMIVGTEKYIIRVYKRLSIKGV